MTYGGTDMAIKYDKQKDKRVHKYKGGMYKRPSRLAVGYTPSKASDKELDVAALYDYSYRR